MSLKINTSDIKLDAKSATPYPSPVSTSPSPVLADVDTPEYQDQALSFDSMSCAPLPEDTIPSEIYYNHSHECFSHSSGHYGCWDELPKCGFSDSSMDSDDDLLSYDNEPPYCPPCYDEPLCFVQIDYKRDETGKYQPVYSLGDCGARLSQFLD